MKAKFMKCVLSIGSNVYASDNVNTKIDWVSQRGNGKVIIKFDDVINEAESANSEVTIAANNPNKEGLLSIALAVKMAKVRVNVKSDDCEDGTLTITGNGYLILTP